MNIADIYPDPSQTLLLHRKHQHLSYSERLYVYKLIVNGNQEKGELSSLFNISLSSINNILKEFNPGNIINSLEGWSKASKILHSSILRQFIMKFVETHNNPFTSNDVILAVKKRFWITIQKHQLIKFLKEHLNLSFKKGTSRPEHIKQRRLSILKWLFSVRLTKRIASNSLLINIDESTFSRITKRHYSWLGKGENCSIKNTKFSNSM